MSAGSVLPDYRELAARLRLRGESLLWPEPSGALIRDLLDVIDGLLECQDCGGPVEVPARCADCADHPAEPAPWCPVHQHHKPCEHNGGVMTDQGYAWPADDRQSTQEDNDV